jgi:hypothetical protein
MNRISITVLVLLLAGVFQQVAAQGSFLGYNSMAQTRISTFDGVTAGTNIFGQFLAGTNLNSLVPVGVPSLHVNGYVVPTRVTVNGIDGGTYAWVQLVAWNRSLWGETLDGVPADQLGRTDIASIFLSYFWQPVGAPTFSQPAIVPIPEPSLVLLSLLAAGLFVLHSAVRCHT